MNYSFLSHVFSWIEKKAGHSFYPYILTVTLVLLSLFFATPRYLYLDSMPEIKEGWEIVTLKSKDLTNSLTHLKADSHSAKTVFRLTVPVFVKLFSANQVVTYFIQFILGFVLLFNIYKISNKIFENVISATLVTSGIVFLYFGRACFVDFTWYDGWAFFALIMALSVRNVWVMSFFCLMAAWTDERALIVLPIIMLFKQIENNKSGDFSLKNLYKLNKSTLFVLSSIIVYFVIRGTLMLFYNMHTPNASADLATLKMNLPVIGIGLWTFFEGFWLVILVALAYMIYSKSYMLALFITLQIIISSLVSFSVFDITRSGSYLAPLLFVMFIYLKGKMEIKEINSLLFTGFLLTFLFPAYYIIGTLGMYQPIYFEVLNFLLNKTL